MVGSGAEPLRIVMVGAGNLATHLGRALHEAGHEVVQVFSRTSESAGPLAARLGAEAVTSLEAVRRDADAYVVAVKDAALEEVVAALCKSRPRGVFMHTAGSMPMSVFQGHAEHFGVLYPMQTFSKHKDVDFSAIPVFVEASGKEAESVIRRLAQSVSRSVYSLSSDGRRYLHLAAVFACNFVNHCYALSAEVLESQGIPFSVMLPLIDETARKVHTMPPHEAQTGPAVRFDENVIRRQMQLLSARPEVAEIYEKMSKNIHQHHAQ